MAIKYDKIYCPSPLLRYFFSKLPMIEQLACLAKDGGTLGSSIERF
jgi:hypothetical protein